MTTKEHEKHSDLKRPAFGRFHRAEWAILGAPCSVIQELAGTIISSLSATYKGAYIDAKHEDEATASLPRQLGKGAVTEYIVHHGFHQFSFTQPPNDFETRKIFSSADFVLVNGNHHQAKAQVLIIDERKEASVKKRIAQLSNVVLILTTGATPVYDFLQEVIPRWQEIPVIGIYDTEKVIAFFRESIKSLTPPLHGLVLAGGKSMRMGSDKSAFTWHGKEQKYYLADLLTEFCEDVFISCRPEQLHEINPPYKALPDTFSGLGPYGAILSAFRSDPEKAWLVVACDLPMLTSGALKRLKEERNISTIATTFQSDWDQKPEPLITIWEPKSYPLLLSYLSQGYSCPRKVLLNNDITLLPPPEGQQLMNVNTKEEADKAMVIIANQNKQADVAG